MFLQPLVSLPDPFLTGGGVSRDPVCRPSRRQPEVHAPGDGHPLERDSLGSHVRPGLPSAAAGHPQRQPGPAVDGQRKAEGSQEPEAHPFEPERGLPLLERLRPRFR